ncbi:MAG: hypothetical protein V3T61_05535 [Acidobacteriota bacterium]
MSAVAAFAKFSKGVMRMPVHWRLWQMLLLVANLIVPILFLDRLESQMVLGAVVVAAGLMTLLTALAGFTRLLGLGHLPWVPLVYFLWTRLDQIPANDLFGLWIRILMVLNCLSLAIDTVDTIRYIAGEREETVKGL